MHTSRLDGYLLDVTKASKKTEFFFFLHTGGIFVEEQTAFLFVGFSLRGTVEERRQSPRSRLSESHLRS